MFPCHVQKAEHGQSCTQRQQVFTVQSVTVGGWSAKGPLLMLHDRSASETRAHGTARLTEEDQEGNIKWKNDGTCKDARLAVRRAGYSSM